MTREKFLDELRIALQGNMSQAQINEHLQYYDNYIMEESRKRKTEQKVIEALGEPRLIAKTLISASENYDRDEDNNSYKDNQSYNKYEEKNFQANYSQENGWDVRYKRFRLNSWYGKLIIGSLLVLIFVFIIKFILFLVPIVVPIILIILLLRIMFKNIKE